MRRRAFIGGAASGIVGLSGCSTFYGTGAGGAPRDRPGEASAGGYFVLYTATHNDFAGRYYVDDIARDGEVVESFEGGVDNLETVELDRTQKYAVTTEPTVTGDRALQYDFGPQESRSASNSRGHLRRPMEIRGATSLSFWAYQESPPQDDIRAGWGVLGDDSVYSFAFNLKRETTNQIHVRTDGGDGANVGLGVSSGAEWYRFVFDRIDWEGGAAVARVRTESGEELATQSVSFEPPV